LDLSGRRLGFCLLDGRVEVGAATPDGDGLRGLARRVELRQGAGPVRAAIESMNGARFVHDSLEREGGGRGRRRAGGQGPGAVGVQDRPHRRVGAGRAHPPLLGAHRARLPVDVASPDGGRLEADPRSDPRDDSRYSADDLLSLGFISSPEHARLVEESKPLADVPVGDYDALLR
jgi:hypothetical protein